jgi:restriction endonuclease S subunit
MAQTNIISLNESKRESRLDSEYFQKEILSTISKMRKIQHKKLAELCLVKSGKTPQYYIKNGKTKIIRSGDLNKNLFIDEEELLKTNENKLFFVQDNDVLISSIGRGSIGKINIYSNYNDKAKLATVSEVNILRNSKINPHYLFIFLRTKFGQKQIDREITGATGQQHLLKSNVRKIIIPIPSNKFQNKIQEIVLKAKDCYRESKELYNKAKVDLLEEVDLKDYKLEKTLSFTTNYLDLKQAKRIDADYFQPKYNNIITKVEHHSKLEKLGNLVSIKKGIEVGSNEYQESGIPFIRVSNISELEINSEDQKYITNELYSKLQKKFSPKQGEILLTKDASIGISFLLNETKSIIVSSGILRLKVNEKINPVYLNSVLNSLFLQLQIERDGGGSVIRHWKYSKVKEVSIPLIPREKQQKIADLVERALNLRKSAKELLEQAKKEVEDFIEKA